MTLDQIQFDAEQKQDVITKLSLILSLNTCCTYCLLLRLFQGLGPVLIMLNSNPVDDTVK